MDVVWLPATCLSKSMHVYLEVCVWTPRRNTYTHLYSSSPSQLYTDTMTRLVLKLKWQGKCVESLNMCSCLILKIQHEILPWFWFYLGREWKKNLLDLGVSIMFVAEHVLYCLLFNNILDFLIVVDLVRLFFFCVLSSGFAPLNVCSCSKKFTVVFHWISPSLLQIVVFLHLCIWFNWYHRRIAVTSAPSYIQMGGRAARWVARCRSKMYFFEVFNLFVQSVKCICQNLKVYLSKLKIVFVSILKRICPNWHPDGQSVGQVGCLLSRQEN